jgi:hypothetical protein
MFRRPYGLQKVTIPDYNMKEVRAFAEVYRWAKSALELGGLKVGNKMRTMTFHRYSNLRKGSNSVSLNFFKSSS